jgi:hypothetical protein
MTSELRLFALLQKEKTYFGAPCRKGHNGLRYTVNSDCIECVKHRRSKEDLRKYMTEYRKKESNKKYQKEYQTAYMQTEKYKKHKLEYVAKNQPLLTAKTRRYQTSKENRTPVWLTQDDHWMIEQAYELAAIRTKIFGFKWHVDHTIPLQGALVSGLHTPHNLQVIPAKENLRKSNKFVVTNEE